MKTRLTIGILGLLVVLGLAACDNSKQQKQDAPPQGSQGPAQPAKEFQAMPGQSTPIHFSHLEMNFKPVTSGDTVIAVFPFKNMSQETVRISQAVTSCNCMQTKFTQGNIQPGQLGDVTVHFLTEGQKGRHEKIIAVVLENYDETITLRLNGEVMAPAQ